MGSSRATIISPHLSQYQTGMRWPHQSCREMHQSRIPSIHWRYSSPRRSGMKRSVPSTVGLQRWLGERRHLHEPLVREARLHHGFAAVAVPHRMAVILDFVQQTQLLELGHDLFPGDEPIEPAETLRHRVVEVRVGCENVDRFQMVAASDLEVERIVGGSHLHGTAPELGIHF